MKNQSTKIFYIFAFLFLILAGASCSTGVANDYGNNQPRDTNLAQFQSTQELKKFSSTQELTDFLDKANSNSGNYGTTSGGIRGGIAMDIAAPMAAQKSAAESTASGGAGAAGYSQT